MSNLLIITSSGGGGLLQSAIAIEQEERKNNPSVNIVKKDLLLQWTGGLIGLFGRFFYNWTQRSGKVFFTNLLVRCNLAAEYVFYPIIFIAALNVLFRKKIDRVIDNQVMGVGPIIKAIRLYNKITKKNIVLQKVFVDFPTKEYGYYVKPIKKLSKNDKKYIRIITIEPLLDGEKTNGEFWERYCGLKEDQITYKRYTIRLAFKDFEKLARPKEDFEIKIRSSLAAEKILMQKCFSKGSINAKATDEGFSFSIKKEDKLFVLLLGSQPSGTAVLEYLRKFILEIKEKKIKTPCHLFVFSDKFLEEKKCLFHKIYDLLEGEKDLSQLFSLVPMGFQKDDVIAPLFFRSDLTITRSGGHTMMELMAIAKGENWIHSEAQGENPTFEELIKGIPCWEAGNARYFSRNFKGEIITPKTLISKIREKKVL